MTKTEQARLWAWRCKVLREAASEARNIARRRLQPLVSLGLVEKAESFRAGAASHPSTPAASDDGSQPAAPRARRAMRLRRCQQPVMLKTGFVQRVRRVARREGSRRRAARELGATGPL